MDLKRLGKPGALDEHAETIAELYRSGNNSQMIANKYNTSLEFPKLDDEMIPHFVRGYFDGDGCIHRRKNSNNYVVHIIGTESFIRSLQQVVPVPSFIHQRTKKSVWFLGIYKRKDIATFGEWLYTDAIEYMDRKNIKFPTLDAVV